MTNDHTSEVPHARLMGASADHLASPFRYASARALCYCLVAQVSVLAAIDCSATPVLEVKNHFLVGNELRLIVETTVRHDAILPDAPSKTSDAKGWLISVELSSPGPLTERARVYGPLWDTPISHTGFGGLVFTEDDRKAALSTPFVAFDHEGKVVRISHTTSNGPLPRSMLDTTPVPAIWKQLTPFSPRPERIEPRSEESLQTPSHRYELRRGTDGKVTLYETLTGTPISNPWLTRAFATYREMKDMRNVTAWITEDLQYLVCFPAWIWNRSFEHLPIVTEFEWAGKSYSRKEYAFMLHEPNSDPIIFQRPSIAGSKRLWGEPQSVFVADGDLYFQYGTETNVVLWPFSSGRRYELQTSSLKGWDRFAGSRFQHMPNDGKIAFFIDDAPTTHRHPSENILVFLWDYRKDTVTRYETHIRELFRNHFGEYKPRKSTKPLEQ